MSSNYEELIEILESKKPTKVLGPVKYFIEEKTPYSFHFYALHPMNERTVVTEMLYDLRNKNYFIKRNGREVKFNVSNLDTVIPREKEGGTIIEGFHSKEATKEFFKMISVKENEGMYEAMLDVIGSMGFEYLRIPSRALIRLITKYHKLELVYKAGMDISLFGEDVMELIHEASKKDVKKLHQVFGTTKSQFRYLREYDEHRFADNLQYISWLDDNDLRILRSHMDYVKKLEKEYNVDGRWNVFKNQGGGIYYYYLAKISKERGWYGRNFYSFLFQYNPSNPARLIEYLLFECYLSQGMEFSEALSYYLDYYRMCKELNYERFIKYPKYLKTYHDIVSMNYKETRDQARNRKFKQAVLEYKNLEEDNVRGYSVVVPESAKDLVYEGNILQHCVGSYIRSVAENRTQIVFLRERKNKEDPLVTVEIQGDEIVQARGQANRLPEEEEKQALRRYAKKKNLKIAASYL